MHTQKSPKRHSVQTVCNSFWRKALLDKDFHQIEMHTAVFSSLRALCAFRAGLRLEAVGLRKKEKALRRSPPTATDH